MVCVRVLSAAAPYEHEHIDISELLSSVPLEACSENILVIADQGCSSRLVDADRQLVRCALYHEDRRDACIGSGIFRIFCLETRPPRSSMITAFICTGSLLSALRAEDSKRATLVFNDGHAEHRSEEDVLKVERCYALPPACRVVLDCNEYVGGPPSPAPVGLLRGCDLQRQLLGQIVDCEGGYEAFVYLNGSLLRACVLGEACAEGILPSLTIIDECTQVLLRRNEPYSALRLEGIFPFGPAGLAAVFGGYALAASLRRAFACSSSGNVTRTYLLQGPSAEDATALLCAACNGHAELVTVSAGQLLAEGGPPAHRLLTRTAQYCLAMAPALLFIEDLDALLPDKEGGGGGEEDGGALDMAAALCSVLRAFNGPDCGPVALVAYSRSPTPCPQGMQGLFRAQSELQRPTARVRRQVAAALLGNAGEALLSDDIDSTSTCALARALHLRVRLAPSGACGAAANVTTGTGVSGFCAAVAGLAEVKSQLYEAVVWPRKHPGLFQQFGVQPDIGVLLYGPPGTGKTLLPSVLAAELACTLLHLRLSDVVRGDVGTGERRVAAAFQEAKASAPSIVFIDEFQAIFTSRDGEGEATDVGQSLTATLAACFDDVSLWSKHAGAESLVTVICSTNEPWAVDSAFLRAGRLDRLLFVGPLDAGGREQLLRDALRVLGADVGAWVAEVAGKTEGFTGADASLLVQRAWSSFCHRGGASLEEHFWGALKGLRPSVTKLEVDEYRLWASSVRRR